MYTHKLNHIQVAVDIFVATNHGNQKYSESYRNINDFDTWLKVLGIVSNEIYRYRPCLRDSSPEWLTNFRPYYCFGALWAQNRVCSH